MLLLFPSKPLYPARAQKSPLSFISCQQHKACASTRRPGVAGTKGSPWPIRHTPISHPQLPWKEERATSRKSCLPAWGLNKCLHTAALSLWTSPTPLSASNSFLRKDKACCTGEGPQLAKLGASVPQGPGRRWLAVRALRVQTPVLDKKHNRMRSNISHNKSALEVHALSKGSWRKRKGVCLSQDSSAVHWPMGQPCYGQLWASLLLLVVVAADLTHPILCSALSQLIPWRKTQPPTSRTSASPAPR